MKTLVKTLFLLLLILPGLNTQASEAVNLIREYARITYGKDLKITSSQIEQLSWAMDNPNFTPEMSADRLPSGIHREILRALSRLYSLQLLRSGSEEAYDAFILPQKDLDIAVLSQQHFNQLSELIRGLDDESYDTLSAAALISAVTMSPTARERASIVLGEKLPEDSTQFLSVTAEKATSIYPLAKEVASKYHSDGRKFTIVFLPDSHLRHMMYNEGSLNMYTRLKEGFRSGQLKLQDLNLWYAYWVDNIAGFRGHVSAKGSLYLTENTFRAMNQIKTELDRLLKDPDFNPVPSYLIERARWLKLSDYKSLSTPEIQALGALAAMMRLFTPEKGSQLLQAFRKLPGEQQKRWINHVQSQLQTTVYATPTYAPALFANTLLISNLTETVEKVLPFYLNALDTAAKARKAGELSENTPLSFRVLANDKQVRALLKSAKPMIQVDSKTGLATLK
ncbi:DUF6829 domain-containing protein [Endozoicomonas numazuensis]|uniref:Uncharacterized protein n=1 Tax=Endozoicomonas numazuensis TaxID=1137799 RepID=A0A081NK07_9GAMM|nr:hypothetical protein [Endozoicomonas numazuensis]KEQ18780.1 hypothetical protein GZ78_01445 [Endozoicomonas numazuensis]